jgi:hypothetical protein
MTEYRKITAILAADVVGFSRLPGLTRIALSLDYGRYAVM